MQADKLTRQIYIWSKSLSDGGVINWTKRTSNTLNSLYECSLLQQGHDVGGLWDATMTQELQTWISAVHEIPRHSRPPNFLPPIKEHASSRAIY